MDLNGALDGWRRLLGSEAVLEGPAATRAYGADTSGQARRIAGALRIAEATQLPAILQIAQQCRTPLYPLSTGRNWGYGSALPVRDDCVILDLSGLARILDFDAELGVVTLEPGVTQRMLADFLTAGRHPFLVPVTGAGPECSLIGNALERGYGITPLCDHFGAVTDIEAILADGSRYRTAMHEAGGKELARLSRHGIGPYSVGLFSQGNFGIVTRMSIALARRPDAVRACFFNVDDDSLLGEAVLRVRSIQRRLPGVVGGINLMNRHRVLAMTAPYPRSELGEDGLIPQAVLDELGRRYRIAPWSGFVTLYGTRRVVAAAEKEIRAQLAGVASRPLFVGPAGSRRIAALARRIPGSLGRSLASKARTLAGALELVDGVPNETALRLAYWRNSASRAGPGSDPARDGCGLLWYAPLVPMRPVAARRCVDMIRLVTREYGIEPLITLTALGDKLFDITVPLLFDRGNASACAAALNCHNALLRGGQSRGFFPYRVGAQAMAALSELQPEARAFHGRLRAALDPHGLIAPGRYA